MSKIDTQAKHGWQWLGGTDDSGYGVFSLRSRMFKAHRVAWLVFRGPIPPGFQVLHTCDTPPCVCPSCLFLGDNAANVADRMAKGRTHSKATPEIVRYIREQVASGVPQRQLAQQFALSPTAVHKIVHNLRWRHLT